MSNGEERYEEQEQQEEQQEEQEQQQEEVVAEEEGRNWFRLFIGTGVIVIILLLVWIGFQLTTQPPVTEEEPTDVTTDEPRIDEDVIRIEDPGLSRIHTKSVMKEDGEKIVVEFEWQKRPEEGAQYTFAVELWDNSEDFNEEKVARKEKEGGDEADRGKMEIELSDAELNEVTHARIVVTGDGQNWESSGGFIAIGDSR